MKIKIFTLLAALLILPATAMAQVQGSVFSQGMNGQQSMGVRNDAGATINALNLGWGTFAVDSKGGLLLSTAVATGIGHLEDSTANSGDGGVATLSTVQDPTSPLNLTSAVGDYGTPAINRQGVTFVDVNTGLMASNALPTSILKLEDSAAASGDALVGISMKRVDQIGTASDAANGDYVHPRTNSYDAQWVQLSASSHGGALRGTIVSAATTNAQSFSGGQSNLFGYVACNNTTTLKYVKLYDKASAPSCGSDTVRHTIMVPKEGCVSATLVPGMDFAAGIALCMVANMAITDNTAIGANEVSFSYISR